jgi:hypothetical protein
MYQDSAPEGNLNTDSPDTALGSGFGSATLIIIERPILNRKLSPLF